jgi:hypothetical protein
MGIAFLVATSASAATQTELLNALTRRGLLVDTQTLHGVAVEAMIQSIDPHAHWQTDGETEAPDPSIVAAEVWEEQVRYVKFLTVSDDSPADLAATGLWHTQDTCAIILDLRDAGGNSPDGAREVARKFRPALTTPWLLDADENPFLSASTGTVKDAEALATPLAVIVNARTRGAAEVLAGAVAGADGVIVIGEPTEGDMAFREDLRINEQQVLHMAVIRYHLTTPTNTCLVTPRILIPDTRIPQALGRVPTNDVRLRPLSERAAGDRALMTRVQDDAPLQRAVDILLGLQAADLNDVSAGKKETKEPDEPAEDIKPEPAIH